MDTAQLSDSSDSASITSTVEEDRGDDNYYDVNAVLAEGVVENQTKYLIEWKDYPLHQATWEPRDHLDESLFQGWLKTKRERIANGQLDSHASKWKAAVIDYWQTMLAHHNANNEERAQQGLPQTVMQPDVNEVIEEVREDYPDTDFIESPSS